MKEGDIVFLKRPYRGWYGWSRAAWSWKYMKMELTAEN